MNYQNKSITQKTAFVFAGGGSFGATQVGMMQALAEHGVVADMVVGSSVCAMNGAYYAGTPTLEEVEQLAGIWPGFRRQDVFPIAFSMLVGFLWRWDFLVSHSGLPKLIDEHLPSENLEDAMMPVHIVATDIVSGNAVVLCEGSAREAITATTSTASRFGHRQIRVAFSRCRRTGRGFSSRRQSTCEAPWLLQAKLTNSRDRSRRSPSVAEIDIIVTLRAGTQIDDKRRLRCTGAQQGVAC
jgi:hypothetical protein